MSDFVDLHDAGRRLAPLLPDDSDAIVVAALPNGAPVAVGLREVRALPVIGLEIARTDEGATALPDDAVATAIRGRTAIVVDDGVETGTVARAAAAALAPLGAVRLVLAVPVCPREVEADLARRYDAIVACVRPLARRSLAWHFADFDTVDVTTARSLIAALS